MKETMKAANSPAGFERRRQLGLALRMLAAVGALLAVWALAAFLVAKPFLPSPQAALRRAMELCADGSLILHTLVSARRVFLAIACALPPAVAIGIAAGRSPKADALVSPLLYLIHPLPKIAFLPLVMLFFGVGDPSKVIIIALIIFSQLCFSARDAARRTPEALVDAVRSMGAGSAATLRHVILPQVMPELFTALRISLGSGIAVLFFSETFATAEGLGWLVMDAWSRVNYPDMYAAILALGAFGLVCFGLLDALEWLVCRWKRA